MIMLIILEYGLLFVASRLAYKYDPTFGLMFMLLFVFFEVKSYREKVSIKDFLGSKASGEALQAGKALKAGEADLIDEDDLDELLEELEKLGKKGNLQ